MIQDVDATFRELLVKDAGIDPKEIDISFERPSRDWSSRLSRPTLNLFLYEICEREELKDDLPMVTRDADGKAVKQRPPRRIDLVYLITAWTSEPEDEHRILSRVLVCLFKHSKIEEEFLQGSLVNVTYPVLARIPDKQTKIISPDDLWGVLDNEMRVSLNWIITAPLDVFAPVTGPLVRAKEIRVGTLEKPNMENLIQISGILHQKGKPDQVFTNATLTLQETGVTTWSDAAGKFNLLDVQPGNYNLVVVTPDGKTRKVLFKVPSAIYDVEI